ncbi:MAG TPA: TRAP transporter small permease subunit [Burkholderiaceae bacterium]|nr:TRAP transporter small permease subunit [Burkholderiaceae bacterium]
MPALTFVLPHWLYWAGLLLFPLAAMFLVRRERRRGPPAEPALFSAYMFWVFAGFAGLHRLYVKSLWGFVFPPLLLGILYCNSALRDQREDVSRTHADVEEAQTIMQRAKPNDEARASEEERAAYAQAQADLAAKQRVAADAAGVHSRWVTYTRITAGVLAVLLLVDAALIPGLVRRRRAATSAQQAVPQTHLPVVHEAGTGEDPTLGLHTRLTDWIDRANGRIGEFVAYWGVIAVFAYYYEVLARYVFNSPTNWVHESMFLMFGMQYMLSGAYAYREDQHVRVDVVYVKLSTRAKAIADIVSSVFFFIFTVTMLYTGGRFALDAIHNSETSFTEWGIEYWPVKLTIPVGAALIILQGVAKLFKDVLIATRKGA